MVEAMVPGEARSLGEFYRLSWYLGWRGLLRRREIKQAVARLVNPLSYPRYREYELVLRGLRLRPGLRVLDIGSPKLLAVLLASRYDIDLWITDLRDYFIASTRSFLDAVGRGADIGRRLHLETQDARALGYDSGSFDRVYAVSVVEHIPDDGDSRAMAEIARVLRPGGIAALTVPFAATYGEEFVPSDVYERQRHGQELVFYQRRYDDAALHRRLIEPSGLEVAELRYFGEPRVPFEPTWNRLPLALRLPWLWAQPFIAQLLLRDLAAADHGCALGVALVLRKPALGA